MRQNSVQSLENAGFPYKIAGFRVCAIGGVSALSWLAESQA